jgi:hypothetical protein
LPPRRDPAAGTPAPGDAVNLFPEAGEPTDDTPTVITRLPPRPASSEDVFSGTLRGRRLAHFELIEPIGVGGMAAVIRARDLQLERQVALKILPPEMAADPENVRRFQQEARAAAKLDHENIARVFFCGEDQKLHFIAFEFVEGMNLRTLIERRGRLPVAEVIRYMLQVATGLAHAAERGVIHRDIKPSNIIISPHGRTKLVDMGLARQVDLHKDLALTQSGVTLGTFDYISPEQALEPRDADVRSDLYSLGCTFYHALTGQPPVPDGTAARKLHHHQHVAPVDPRQLNPDIPDEVAAILARLMAKDAKDRYQRPEHLVQHLMQVAPKLGAVSEVPEGVLFVDAPLPSPPRPRPVLMAVLAALALVGVIVVVGQTTPRPQPRVKPLPPEGNQAKAPPADAPAPAREEGPGPKELARPAETPAHPPVPTLATYDPPHPQAAEVAAFLGTQGGKRSETGKPPQAMVSLREDLDLGGLGPAGLVWDGGEGSTLTIGPTKDLEASRRPVLRLHFDATRPSSGPWTGLTVRSGVVTLRGLCIDVSAAGAPSTSMAALARQGGRLVVENCVFVQELPAQEGQSLLTGVRVEGPPNDGGPAAVRCFRCCFLAGRTPEAARAAVAGQNAITVRGDGLVELNNCAFGPHAAVVAVQKKDGADAPPEANVQMQQCSALLAAESAVVLLQNTRTCTLTLNECLFSRPDLAAAEGEPQAVLVRQIDPGVITLAWNGSNNRYHNLDAFWVRPDGEPLTQLDDFRRETGGKEVASQVLAASPWVEENPLGKLDLDGEDRDALHKAFQVQTRLRDLRSPLDLAHHLIGVERLAWSDPYNQNLPSLAERPSPQPVARNVKVVVPDEKASRNPGDYTNLLDALDHAAPGDTILLRHTGLYPIRPLALNRPTLDVTIKADRDCRPVLTLSPETDDEEAALFRLHDGKLRLEGLGFALHPANARFKAQTVVASLGEGTCTFQDCVFTLEEAHDARLAAVTLADLPGVFKMDRPSGQRAAFAFQNCFVRGDGDLIAARASRPLDLQADNTLVVLSGSLLHREAGDDAAPPAADVADSVRLAHVTTFLVGHLVHWRARDTRLLIPERFRSISDCLFVSGGGSLVHLDGAEASDERLKALLTWDQGQHNAYVDFPSLLDQQPDSGAMAMPYARDQWKVFTRETDAVFDRVKLRDKPGEDTPLATVTPARFQVKPDEMRAPDMQAYGADLDQLPKVSAPADAVVTPEQ